MAQQQPLAAAAVPFPIFIDTSLETHLAVVVSPDDTVRELKRKVIMEHAYGFPEIGEITILAIKVRRRSTFYRLSESMKVKDAFVGTKGWGFLYVDVNCATKVKSLAAMPSIEVLSGKIEKLGKSCMVEMDTGVKDATITERCHVNEVGRLISENDQNFRPIVPFELKPSPSQGTSAAQNAKERAPEIDVPIPVDFNRSEGSNRYVRGPNHLLENPEGRRDDPCTGEHILVRSDFQIRSDRMANQEENDKDEKCENPLFKEMEEGLGILPMSSRKHKKRAADFDGNNHLAMLPTDKKKRKKLKVKESAEDHANILVGVAGMESNMSAPDLEKNPERIPNSIGHQTNNEDPVKELINQRGPCIRKSENNQKKKHSKTKGKRAVEDRGLTHLEAAGTVSNKQEPASEILLEIEPERNDSKNIIEGAENELGDNLMISNEATTCIDENGLDKLPSEAKARKKSKRKKSVEEIPPEEVVDEPNGFEPDLKNMPDKGLQHARTENTNEVVGLIEQSLNASEKIDHESPKKAIQRKRKKKHPQSNESLAKVDENPCLEACFFPTDEKFNPGESVIDPSPNKRKKVLAVVERNNEENRGCENSNVTNQEAPNDKVKKSRRKKSSTSGKEQMVASLAENKNAPIMEIRIMNDHLEHSLAGSYNSVENADGMLNTVESAKNLAVSLTEVDLPGVSSVHNSNFEKKSTDLTSESFPESQNNNTDVILSGQHAVTTNFNKALEKNPERSEKVHREEQDLDLTGEMMLDAGLKILPDANISKRRTKQKKNVKPEHLISKSDNNYSLEEHPSSGHDGSDAIDLRHDEISLNPLCENPVDVNSVKSNSCNKRRLQTSKKKLPQITEPDNIEVLRPGTPLSELQANGDNRSGVDVLQTDLQKATSNEVQKKQLENINTSKLSAEVLLTINSKGSQNHMKNSAKNNPSSLKTVNVEENLDTVSMVSLKKDKDADSREYIDNLEPGFASNATFKSSDSYCGHGSKYCVGTECPGNITSPGEVSNETYTQIKVPASKTAKDGGLQCSVSPRSEVGKSNLIDIFLPNRGLQGLVTNEEETATKETDTGKVKKVKSKSVGKNKTLVRPQNTSPGSASIPSPHDSRRHKKVEVSASQGYVDKGSLKEHNTVSRGGDAMEKTQVSLSLLDKQREENKNIVAGEPSSKMVDTCLDVVQPGSRIISMPSKAIDRPVASSDSTEEKSPNITRRYRVAIRKVPRAGLRNFNKSSDKHNLSVKDDIFDDDSSSSTHSSLNKNHQKTTLKGSDISYSTSLESDGDLNDTQSSQALPTKVIDFRANTGTERGYYGIETRIPDSDGGRLSLSAILKNSSTYKKAKILASKRLDEEKSESQPADIVPETQPEDIVAS